MEEQAVLHDGAALRKLISKVYTASKLATVIQLSPDGFIINASNARHSIVSFFEKTNFLSYTIERTTTMQFTPSSLKALHAILLEGRTCILFNEEKDGIIISDGQSQHGVLQVSPVQDPLFVKTDRWRHICTASIEQLASGCSRMEKGTFQISLHPKGIIIQQGLAGGIINAVVTLGILTEGETPTSTIEIDISTIKSLLNMKTIIPNGVARFYEDDQTLFIETDVNQIGKHYVCIPKQ